MVGYTNTNIFKPGDFCYIIVYTVDLLQPEKPEFLEGKVTDVDKPPVPKPVYHPLWKFWPEKPPTLRTISAIVTADSLDTQKETIDPLTLFEEPHKDYLVIAPREYEAYLYKKIDRQEKMIQVQEQRLKELKRQLDRFLAPQAVKLSSVEEYRRMIEEELGLS